MKSFFCLLFFSLAVTCLKAQTSVEPVQRRIQFHSIGKDSINLSLNEDYDLIEDSCAQIIRQGHLDIQARKFFGKFKDVSKRDPSIVLSEGNYTADGLKRGLFISHYLNGNLRSKGIYVNNNYYGKWEIYYENGKPALFFEASGDTVRISDAWNKSAKKTVEKGKGVYQVNLGGISWKGKMEDGRPNGIWTAFRTDDASEATLIEELFRKGNFQKGRTSYKDYTDVSRIILVPEDMLPFFNVEKLRISVVACDGIKSKHIVNAQYKDGTSTFSTYVFTAVSNMVQYYVKTITTINGSNTLTISGNISEKGDLINIKSESPFNSELADMIIRSLRNLPLLQPATIDGSPVKQPFTITLEFKGSTFSMSYRFLPIKV